MTDTEQAAIIEQGLAGAFWQLYLLPRLKERGKTILESLAAGSAPDDDIKRGRFQEIRYLIDMPTHELAVLNREAQQRDDAHKTVMEDQFRADMGFRSPYRLAPEPGSTKSDESDNPIQEAS